MKQVYFNHIPGNIHPVYQEMLDNPPEGVEYINKDYFGKNYQKNIISNENNDLLSKFTINIIPFFKKYYILPSITFKKLPGEVVFSASKICLFNDYILDLEAYEALNRFSNKISNNFLNKFIVKILLKRKNCKRITFWSDNAKKGFQSYFGNIFDDKLEVIYPAISLNNNFDEVLKNKDNSKINFLFVGRYFERKGGLIAIEIFEKLSKKYNNIYFNIISNVDNDIIASYKNNKNIIFLGLLDRNSVLKYFLKSDFYIMPTFLDTFGMVFLEAFSYGCIPITLNTYAVSNIIDNNKDGIFIDYDNKFYNNKFQFIDEYNYNINYLLDIIDREEKERLINLISEKLELLINNYELRYNFMINGFEKVSSGKFSIKKRNYTLTELINI